MSIAEDIVDAVRKVLKQNPWVPYRGPAGGQGWVNQMTGEVRYQENRPAPGEGMPEEYDPEQIPEVEDVPETLEPPSEEELLAEHLEEGDEITVDLMDSAMEEVQHEGIEAEIVYGSDSEYGPNVEYNHPESGTVESHQISWEEVADHPAELEPTEGWADGWTDAPRDHLELETGQIVEIYDLERGEYVEGEVLDADDWGEDGVYLRVQTEHHEFEFLDGELQQEGDALVTAAEDIYPPVDPPDEFDVDEYEIGDEVMYWNRHENEVRTGEISDVLSNEVQIYEEETDSYLYVGDDHDSFIFDEEMELEYEMQGLDMAPIEDIPGAVEYPEVLTGGVIAMNHPVFGEAQGEVEVSIDDYGYGWLTVQTEPQVGEYVEVETPQGLVEGEILDVKEDIVGVDEGDGVAQYYSREAFENEVSLTTNPDHPFYVGNHVDQVENPWQGPDTLSIGDQVMLADGTVVGVRSIEDDQVNVDLPEGHEYDEQWVSVDEIEQRVPVDVPEPPQRNYWADPPDEYGEFNPGDEILYYDDVTGGIATAQIKEDYGDGEVETQDGAVVGYDQISGYDDTGTPELPDGDELHYATPGDYVEVVYLDYGDELLYATGFVSSHDEYTGETYLITETGDQIRIDEGTIVDHPEPPDTYQEWEDASASEIAADIAANVDIGSPGPIQGQVRSELMIRHNPAAVSSLLDNLTNNQDGWKRFSDRAKAGTWDQALKRASGSNRPARNGPSPSIDEVRVAETIHELSKQRWRENPPQEVYRGLSDVGAASLFASVLEDPFTADEYEISMLATNNFSENRKTAENLGTAPTVVHFEGHQIDPDQVMAYHDDFFRAPNDGENEIALRGDDMRVPREQFYLNKNTDLNFTDPPHEWTDDQARAFRDKLDRYGTGGILYENNWYDGPTRDQLENAVRIERVLSEKHNIPTGTFFDEAREMLREEYDVDPEAVAYPELAEQGYGGATEAFPEGIGSIEDFQEGMEVQFSRHGDRLYGDIVDVREDGTLEVEEYDYGEVYPVDPEQITEISYAPDFYGPNADLLGRDEPWDPEVFEGEYPDVVVAPYGMGNQVATGTVSQVDGTTVEVFDVDGASGIQRFDVSDATEAARIAPLPDLGIEPDEAEQLEGQTVTFMHPDTDEVVEGTLDSTFPSMHSASIEYEGERLEDPVHYTYIAPVEPAEEDPGPPLVDTPPHELSGPVDMDALAWSPTDTQEGYEPYFDAMGDVDEDQFEEDLRDHYVIWTMGGEAGGGKAVDMQDGQIVLDDGTRISPSSITQRSQVAYPGDSDGPAEGPAIDGPDDVEPGMEVMVPHYDDPGPHEIAELNEDPEYGVTGVVMEDGDVLDFDQIEPAEGPEDFSEQIDETLDEIGLPEDEPEGTDDYSHIPMESIHDAEPAVGEEFLTDFPGGETSVEVIDYPETDMSPYAVEDEHGDQWLIWPDGELEPI